MSQKENLNKIALMLGTLNEKLTNKNLHFYIFDKFECIIDKSFKVKKYTDKGLKAISKETSDTFEITFEPNIENFSKIITSYTCWNNQHIEIKEITFENENITVEENESTIYLYPTKKISSIEKRINKSEYQNNQLIHSYRLESQTYVDTKRKADGTTVEEINILPNKEAVRITSITGEKDYFGTKGIKYYKTDYCDTPDFNTREQNKSLYQYGFKDIEEEEYKQFINLWKTEYKFINKQKKLGK